MYNLMIVDDEQIIRKGLATTLPWEDHGVDIAAIAEDGQTAKQKLKETPIDIVLTDIRMPNMDGLELASYIADHYPDVKTIMLSGYDDFSYAQRAVKIGVNDYLLKPVDIDELLQVIDKIKGDIEKERKSEEEIKETQLKNTIYGSIRNVHGEKEWMTAYQNKRMIPLLSVMKGDYEQHELTKQLSALIDTEEPLPFHVPVFIDPDVLLTCFVTENTREIERINQLISTSSGPTLHVLYPECIRVSDLHDVYSDLIHFLYTRPILDDPPESWKFHQPVEQDRRLPGSLVEKWLQAVAQMKEEEVGSILQEIFLFMKEESFSFEEVTSNLNRLTDKTKEYLSSLFRKEINPSGLLDFQQLTPWQVTYQEMLDSMAINAKELVSPFRDHQADSKAWMIQRAIDYIHTYYMSEIKAQEVADVINLSPNYFSSLFRQQTGKKFNEYIHDLRIEKAKTLLVETPFKVSEVAESVGYQEYKYFVKVFKKQTGMTPTEYRKIMAIQS